MTIDVGGRTFKNHTEASRHTKEILNGYPLGADLNAEDTAFLTAALEYRGSDGLRKIGCGVERIAVEATHYGGRGFHLYRTDGTHTDFSYLKIWQRRTDRIKHTPAMIDFIRACRSAVVEQRGPGVEATHAHHAGDPFIELVRAFIAERAINVEAVVFNGHDDGDMTITFADEDLAREWRDYHAARAVLIRLSPEDHRAEHGRRERP